MEPSDGMPVATLSDVSIYYEIHGDGEPLVLIGGLANDVADNLAMVLMLAQHFEVIAFDNRGVGRSDKPDISYSIETMAADTAELLDALGIQQAHILGASRQFVGSVVAFLKGAPQKEP